MKYKKMVGTLILGGSMACAQSALPPDFSDVSKQDKKYAVHIVALQKQIDAFERAITSRQQELKTTIMSLSRRPDQTVAFCLRGQP